MSATKVDREQFEKGLGNVTWWGFSPARDVWRPIEDDGGRRRVLLLGAGDGRHLLHAVGKEARTERMHFFVYEQNILLYARQILFMS